MSRPRPDGFRSVARRQPRADMPCATILRVRRRPLLFALGVGLRRRIGDTPVSNTIAAGRQFPTRRPSCARAGCPTRRALGPAPRQMPTGTRGCAAVACGEGRRLASRSPRERAAVLGGGRRRASWEQQQLGTCFGSSWVTHHLERRAPPGVFSPPHTPTPRAALFYLQSEVAHTRLFLSPRKGVESRWSGSRIGAEFEGGRQGAKEVSPQRPEKARANLSDDDGRRTTGRVRAESHQPWRAFGRCCRTRHRRESISQSKARASQIEGVARAVAEQERTTAGGAGLDMHTRTYTVCFACFKPWLLISFSPPPTSFFDGRSVETDAHNLIPRCRCCYCFGPNAPAAGGGDGCCSRSRARRRR